MVENYEKWRERGKLSDEKMKLIKETGFFPIPSLFSFCWPGFFTDEFQWCVWGHARTRVRHGDIPTVYPARATVARISVNKRNMEE
jgi:hypothetical protein